MTVRPCPGPAAFHDGDAPLIDEPLCGGCCTRLGQALRDLPEQYAHLWLAMVPSTAQATGGKVSGSREQPLPMAAGPREFMDRILEVCASWAEVVTVELRLSDAVPAPTRTGRLDGWLLTTSCRVLSRHLQPWIRLGPQAMARRIQTWELELLLDRPDGDDVPGRTMAGGAWVTEDLTGVQGALEVLALRREARRMLGLVRGKDRLPEPCPNPDCERKTLVRWHGSDQVECESCSEVWPERDYERLVKVLAAYRENTKGRQA